MQRINRGGVSILRSFLISGRHIHPLVIMLIDSLMVFLSFSLAYVLIAALAFNEASMAKYSLLVLIYSLIAIPFIYFWRLHTGLLRFSNTMDLFRVFGAVISFSMVLLLLLWIFGSPSFGSGHRSIYYILLINFFISVSFLVIFRLVAKSIYLMLMKNISDHKTHRVLIYGDDNDAVSLKRGLERDRTSNYVVAGFIGTDEKMPRSFLEQKRIYHFKDLLALKERLKIEKLLITNENLDERSKRVVIERCIRAGIQVLTTPPIQSWHSGKISKKQISRLRIEDLLQRPLVQENTENIRKVVQGKRVLITGAAGSIGSEIARQMLAYEPSMVILCDQAESPLHEIQLEVQDGCPTAKIEIVLLDICNYKRLHKLFQVHQPDIVYHAAAYKHVPMVENNPFEALSVNVEGTKNLADLALAFDVEKFIMISTDQAINPTNVMGASKRLAEIYIQSLNLSNGKGTRFVSTRFGNMLSSTGSVIPRFRSQIANGGPLTVTHPDITRHFMTTPEAVHLVLEAGAMGKGGEIFVFDMGKPVKIIDVARKMIQLAGLTEGKDITISFTGLRPGEKLYEEIPTSSESTIPTHHPKIRMAKSRVYPHKEACKVIGELIAISRLNDNQSMVHKMKEIVPEFLSNNSVYERLDSHIKTA